MSCSSVCTMQRSGAFTDIYCIGAAADQLRGCRKMSIWVAVACGLLTLVSAAVACGLLMAVSGEPVHGRR